MTEILFLLYGITSRRNKQKSVTALIKNHKYSWGYLDMSVVDFEMFFFFFNVQYKNH